MRHLTKRFVLTFLTISVLTACEKPNENTEVATQAANSNYISEATKPLKISINNPEIINFDGFGPATFGSNEKSVRLSWGRPLSASKPALGSSCYYLNNDPLPSNHQGIAFMFEDAKFVRYEVNEPTLVAPGDIVVGDTADKVKQAHAGHIESQPHKYIEGAQTLTVTPSNYPNKRLIFEIDGHNTVINWRIGVLPQIYYVEGCS